MQDFLFVVITSFIFLKNFCSSATVWLFIRIFATVFHRILDFTTRLGFYPASIYKTLALKELDQGYTITAIALNFLFQIAIAEYTKGIVLLECTMG